MKSILKILAWISGLLLLLVIFLLAPVDRTDYREKDYYAQMMEKISELEPEVFSNDFLLGGWGKANMTPPQAVDLVGYKPRGPYEFVQDSSYVKSILISNNHLTIAFLNYELLIVHPHLAKAVKSAIDEKNLPIDQVVFSATHTHSGMGGYIPGIMGKLAFGGYDEEVVDHMVNSSLKAINIAMEAMDTLNIGFKKTPLPEGVNNRLVEKGITDPYLRQLVIEKTSGQKATLLTYTAHATGIHSGFMGLSGDYPFYLMEALEEDRYEMALFSSGAVGSHSPNLQAREVEKVKLYAADLDSMLRVRSEPSFESIKGGDMWVADLSMNLPPAHYRVSDNIRLRPWVFNSLFGETNANINISKIGNILLLSTSGEVSGMFMEKWESLANNHGLQLIVSTFNGGYTGYIIPDEYYDLRHHEARDMNWYGPHAGSYFDEVFTKIIQKAADIAH
ncbi:neutral/alkaline non-lysosomal ceramidase N-terminal domain-containing protein [Litoribacter ruber]|uniref:neutral/alkaline non-lysosomal ceramidase N-terminal domain-containing protein n=1 Tax=Litoribacter ruber TaxID=702568 RepID=UPI001BD92EE2|nr:neutral/alkaline non-lysosomal ceramidase N-terminal domain-containing protein [Litoribacter ruber]MBT0809999.1 neutral/alkaline non-lysosomal ceramidase N-terminal domain-containing protein [Litoribacter ruber]